jgi:hypothetical protein
LLWTHKKPSSEKRFSCKPLKMMPVIRKPGDNEEYIYSRKSALETINLEVEQDYRQHRNRPQSIDIISELHFLAVL